MKNSQRLCTEERPRVTLAAASSVSQVVVHALLNITAEQEAAAYRTAAARLSRSGLVPLLRRSARMR